MLFGTVFGLTWALYACALDLAEEVQRLRRRKFRVLFALVVISLHDHSRVNHARC